MKKLIIAAASALLLAGTALAQEKPAGDPNAATAPFKVDAPTFVKVVAAGNEWEIQTSRMAEERATSEDVKALATEIRTGHEKAQADLQAADPAAKEPMMMPKQREQLRQLEAAQGPEFEALFLDMQNAAHDETLTLFRTFIASNKPAKEGGDVLAFAEKTLPDIEKHTMHIKETVMRH